MKQEKIIIDEGLARAEYDDYGVTHNERNRKVMHASPAMRRH